MCIMTVAAVTTAVTTLAAVATSTAVSLSQASAQKKAAAFEMEQAQKQAKNAQLEAAYERQAGIESARQDKIKAILSMADEKAKIASSNISMSSGLVLNLEDENKINSELDALTTQKEAEKKAQKYLAQSNSIYTNTSLTAYNNQVNRKINNIKQISGTIGTIGSLGTTLGGAIKNG